MVVNANKTNMICISDSLNYLTRTFFHERSSGERIDSTSEMKLLGFFFLDRPTVAHHVRDVCKRLRQKYWSLRHLGNLGFTEKELVEVYKSSIRPIADYCCVVYHSMLTDEQDEHLEAAQVGALRAIYGTYKISGRKMKEKAGMETLWQRRIKQCDKFARKWAASVWFGHWFPLREGRVSARSSEIYSEKYAHCDRLKNSSLYYMRRRLNGKPGKSYGERNRIYRECPSDSFRCFSSL